MTEMAETFKPVQRTIGVSLFPYFDTVEIGGVKRRIRKTARYGDTVTLTEEADVLRGDNNGHFLKPGQKAEGGNGRPAVNIGDLGLLTDEQLADLFKEKPPTVNEILDAVGDDPGLAARVLAAERGSDHEPRKTLVEKLEQIETGGEG